MGEQLALGIKGVLSVNDPEFLLSPERFAYHRTALSGRINLKEDGRLKEWLQDGSSSVAFDLTFSLLFLQLIDFRRVFVYGTAFLLINEATCLAKVLTAIFSGSGLIFST